VKVCGLLRAATRDPEGWLDLEVAGGSRIEEVIDILHERSSALAESPIRQVALGSDSLPGACQWQ
jgi:hypothetical protein